MPYTKAKIKNFMRSSQMLNSILKHYMKRKYARSLWKHSLDELYRFFKIMKREKINVYLDVGAHSGETGMGLRNLGYDKKIISFEPIKEVFARLKARAEIEGPWDAYCYGLGNENSKKTFHVLENAPGSSFLECHDILEKEFEEYGGLKQTREEKIEIKRLENLYPTFCNPEDRVLLKMDTQGFEKEVLLGAGKYLRHIRLAKLEVSLVPLYKNETLIADMIQFMEECNFIPISIEAGHVSKKTLHQLQADVIFYNQNPSWE